jgi:hypothetical protein
LLNFGVVAIAGDDELDEAARERGGRFEVLRERDQSMTCATEAASRTRACLIVSSAFSQCSGKAFEAR